MLDLEVVGHITDTLSIASLSDRATLANIKRRLNGASHQQFALAAVTVLREQSRRIAELETDVDELTATNDYLNNDVTELEAELKDLRARHKNKAAKAEKGKTL
jgi:cupin superfamily acireductone dioxygenase involved in methionine salvage